MPSKNILNHLIFIIALVLAGTELYAAYECASPTTIEVVHLYDDVFNGYIALKNGTKKKYDLFISTDFEYQFYLVAWKEMDSMLYDPVKKAMLCWNKFKFVGVRVADLKDIKKCQFEEQSFRKFKVNYNYKNHNHNISLGPHCPKNQRKHRHHKKDNCKSQGLIKSVQKDHCITPRNNTLCWELSKNKRLRTKLQALYWKRLKCKLRYGKTHP